MGQDLPSDAHKSHHWLRNGDVVLFATDGLWDNVNIQDVLGLVSGEMIKVGAWTCGGGGITPSPAGLLAHTTITTTGGGGGIQTEIARAVVAKAKSASLNTGKRGQEYFGRRYWGGKVDDITVVAIVVVEKPGNAEEAVEAKL